MSSCETTGSGNDDNALPNKLRFVGRSTRPNTSASIQQKKKKFRARGSRGRGSSRNKHSARVHKHQQQPFTTTIREEHYSNSNASRSQRDVDTNLAVATGTMNHHHQDQPMCMPLAGYTNTHTRAPPTLTHHVTPPQASDFYWCPSHHHAHHAQYQPPPVMPVLEYYHSNRMMYPSAPSYGILPPTTSSQSQPTAKAPASASAPVANNGYSGANPVQQILPPIKSVADQEQCRVSYPYSVSNLPHQRERIDTGTTFVSLSSLEGAPALSITDSGSFDFDPILPNLSSESQLNTNVDLEGKVFERGHESEHSTNYVPVPTNVATTTNMNNKQRLDNRQKCDDLLLSYSLKVPPPLQIPNNDSFERVRKYRESDNTRSLFDVSPRSFLMGNAASKKPRSGF